MTSLPAAAASPQTGTSAPGPHVVVIGGGASGVLMAVHLLSRRERAFRVTVIEGRNAPGHGLAYSTTDPDHLLNTRVHHMSAFPDDPDHFLNWLRARPEGASVTNQCFVSRATYGAYLSALTDSWLDAAEPRRLRVVQNIAIRLQDDPRGVIVHLADGQTVIGDLAILATGHVLEAPDPDGFIRRACDHPGEIDPDARVVIVGSGLSMIDRAVTLLKAGHRGEILSISRRGLLPQPHARTAPLALSRGDVPLGAPISRLMGWVRDQARVATRQGGTWRDAVDGIRPHIRAIWASLPEAERARFLRHAATWWDVHRHRIPPASDLMIQQAMASGQLTLMRGDYLGSLRLIGGGVAARIQPRGAQTELAIPAARIFDCRGIRRDPVKHASPLIADLLARGRARIDPLGIGLEVDPGCRLLDDRRRPSPRLLAIGPASRAAFWEITAIPDIREQTMMLATEMARG